MNDQAKRYAIVLMALPLGLFDAWAAWHCTAEREELAFAREQVAGCEDLARKIEGLRGSPVKVDETARTGDALAKLVESAAQQVGLGTDRIVHVAPGQPRRVGDTAYLEQATAVELRDLTLKQLVEFTLFLGRSAPRLKIASVNIRTPPGDPNAASGRELWNMQLTLTAHVYAPKIPGPP